MRPAVPTSVLGAVIRSHSALHPALAPALVGEILMVSLHAWGRPWELLASVLCLPQLLGGGETDTSPQPQGEAVSQFQRAAFRMGGRNGPRF